MEILLGEQTKEYKLQKQLAYFNLKMSIYEVDKGKSIDLYIKPNIYCNEPNRKEILGANTGNKQKEIYDTLGYWETFLHEGLRFGIDYLEKFIYSGSKSLKICLDVNKWNPGTTHEIAAYVCVLLFCKIMNIEDRQLPYFSDKRNRFIFPYINRFPIERITIEEIKKHPTWDGEEETYEILREQIIAYQEKYFNR